MMNKVLDSEIRQSDSICILGHTSPDGDCVGSTLALWNYIRGLYPQITVRVYLEQPSDKFGYLDGFRQILTGNEVEKNYDLCIVCDCADPGRIGKFVKYLASARRSFLLDHHLTNQGFCDHSVICPEASSTCEVLFDQLDKDRIGFSVAECIYTGIVHDTGVFKYRCTSLHTMAVAGFCMGKGVEFGKIIDDSFYSMNFRARKLLGTVLSNMEQTADGRIVYSILDRKTMLAAGIENTRETDGYIDNIRNTEGALFAAFFYQIPDGSYKASLRSNTEKLNVAEIAAKFEGGGHRMAAGCYIRHNLKEGVEMILREAAAQLDKAE